MSYKEIVDLPTNIDLIYCNPRNYNTVTDQQKNDEFQNQKNELLKKDNKKIKSRQVSSETKLINSQSETDALKDKEIIDLKHNLNEVTKQVQYIKDAMCKNKMFNEDDKNITQSGSDKTNNLLSQDDKTNIKLSNSINTNTKMNQSHRNQNNIKHPNNNTISTHQDLNTSKKPSIDSQCGLTNNFFTCNDHEHKLESLISMPLSQGLNFCKDLEQNYSSSHEIKDDKFELHHVKVSRTKLPKNSMSPNKGRGRGRSRDNDMSSNNIKSALDYSTLDILKNIKDKKEREVSKVPNSCQMFNKGRHLDNLVKNEDTCQDDIKHNKSQVNTSYSLNYGYNENNQRSIQPNWWPESSKRDENENNNNIDQNQDQDQDEQDENINNGDNNKKDQKKEINKTKTKIKSSVSPNKSKRYKGILKNKNDFNISNINENNESRDSIHDASISINTPRITTNKLSNKSPSNKLKHASSVEKRYQNKIDQQQTLNSKINQNTSPQVPKKNSNTNNSLNHDHKNTGLKSILKTLSDNNQNPKLNLNLSQTLNSSMTLSTNTAHKKQRRSPSSRATSKIKDMVQRDRKRSRDQTNQSHNENFTIDNDFPRNKVIPLSLNTQYDQYNFNKYEQYNQISTFNPGMIAENFLKSPFTEHMHDESTNHSNIDSLINKSKFLMSEGSSFNIRQPSQTKKKWDENSEVDFVNSSTFDQKRESCTQNLTIREGNKKDYTQWDQGGNIDSKEMNERNNKQDSKDNTGNFKCNYDQTVSKQVNDSQLLCDQNISSEKFGHMMNCDQDTGDENNVQKPQETGKMIHSPMKSPTQF